MSVENKINEKTTNNMRKPYVILIGSASGIGKSTIAAELAKTLNIKHLIESDFIRAVVRGIIGKDSSYYSRTWLKASWAGESNQKEDWESY